MRFWLDLSIRSKVLLGFASTLLLTCMLGLFGLRESGLINEFGCRHPRQLAAFVGDNRQAQHSAQPIPCARGPFGHQQSCQREQRAAGDQAYLEEGFAAVTKLRRLYEPLIVHGTDDERLMREFDQALICRCNKAWRRVIALAKKPGGRDELVEHYRGEGRVNFDLAASKLAEDLEFSERKE